MADVPSNNPVDRMERDQHTAIRDRLWSQAHSMAGMALNHADAFDEHVVRTTSQFRIHCNSSELSDRRLKLFHDPASLTISAYDRILELAVAYNKKDDRLRRYHRRIKARLQRLLGSNPAERPHAPPVGDDKALRERFERLANWWRDDTGPLSSVHAVVGHPGYQQIIGMGKPVLPLIMEDLRKSGDLWFSALYAITGENPIRTEDRGNIERMRDTWLKWGEQHGYYVS
jgi:hypothetical protein